MQSEVKQRLIEYLAYLGIGQKAFADRVGLSAGFVNAIRVSIQPKTLEKISETFPELNTTWLLTGEGEMLKKKLETKEFLQVATESAIQIPLLPVSAVGGSLSEFAASVKSYECEKVISPINDVDFALQISGDSMAPEYPSGSRIFVKKINERAFIEWGKAYVLDTCNGTVVKILVPSDKEGYVKCISINTDPMYAPFEVCLKDVYGIYRVMLCLAIK